MAVKPCNGMHTVPCGALDILKAAEEHRLIRRIHIIPHPVNPKDDSVRIHLLDKHTHRHHRVRICGLLVRVLQNVKRYLPAHHPRGFHLVILR